MQIHNCPMYRLARIPPKGGRVVLMSPPCLVEYQQGCQFDPTFLYLLLFFCLVLLLSCLILFCFWPILLTSFPPNLHLTKCKALLCGGSWRPFQPAAVLSGYEMSRPIVSWWYVQHMLSCGTGISLYAFI